MRSTRVTIRRALALWICTSLILGFATPYKANAATKVWSTTTPYDTYNRPDLPQQFDILRVEVGLWDNNLDDVHFWIQFKNPLLPSQFNDGLGSWAAILIDTNNDNDEDLRIETRPATYSSNYSQSAYASKNCNAVTWMDLDRGSNNVWLGFKVSQKCFNLPNKFRVQGYVDYNSRDQAGFDYAPDAFSTIDLGDYYNPKPKVTMAVPFSSADFGRTLSNYSSAPENLADLASKLRDSVVTIECTLGTAVGTGTAWAAKVQMPSSSSYQTYLITNYHVISDCIYKGNVDVILNNKTKVNGVLAAWDPDNDLAGIYIQTRLEPMLWQGATPLQGGWAGVLGSPKGLPGVLTTGIVSSVNTKDSWMTFTAPINPGNSGGPVFDSIGRVMAIATAKARDSEGFGIGNGVPLLCEVIVRCAANQSGWTGAITKVTTEYPKKEQIVSLVSDLTTVNYAITQSVSYTYLATSTTPIRTYSSSGLTPTLTSETPNFCKVVGLTVTFIGSGTCTLRADQSGNQEFNPAEPKKIYIGSYYSKVYKSQIIYPVSIPDLSLSQKKTTFNVVASSGLLVDGESDDYNICSVFRLNPNQNSFVVILNDIGTCGLTFSQSGNDDYSPTRDEYVTFEVLPNRTTITCIKGKLTRKVTAVNPKCPVGYKKK